MDFKNLKIQKRRHQGEKNHESFLLRYKSFAQDSLRHRALHFAMAGFYLVKGTRESFLKCAFCDVEILAPESIENAFVMHFNWNGTCEHIQRMAQLSFTNDRSKKMEPWYQEMQSINYLAKYFSLEEIDSWDCDDFLENLLLAKDKCNGGPMCTTCKRRRVQVVYVPCGHFIACRICSDLADKCEKCKSLINECWYPKMEADVEPIKQESL